VKVDVSIIFHILALLVPALLILSGIALSLSNVSSFLVVGSVGWTLFVLGIFIYILEIVFYFGPSHRES
jgi:site-specific recombinase